MKLYCFLSIIFTLYKCTLKVYSKLNPAGAQNDQTFVVGLAPDHHLQQQHS